MPSSRLTDVWSCRVRRRSRTPFGHERRPLFANERVVDRAFVHALVADTLVVRHAARHLPDTEIAIRIRRREGNVVYASVAGDLGRAGALGPHGGGRSPDSAAVH